FGGPPGRGVGEDGVFQLVQAPAHGLRRLQVGLADVEVVDMDTPGARLVGEGHQLADGGGRHPPRAVRDRGSHDPILAPQSPVTGGPIEEDPQRLLRFCVSNVTENRRPQAQIGPSGGSVSPSLLRKAGVAVEPWHEVVASLEVDARRGTFLRPVPAGSATVVWADTAATPPIAEASPVEVGDRSARDPLTGLACRASLLSLLQG